MNIEWILFALDIIALLTVVSLGSVLSKPRQRPSSKEKRYNSGLHGIVGKSPLGSHHQAMYYRLAETLADHIILSKVAFTSLMTTDNEETRTTLLTKTADFVVCGRDFKVEAVVFLDDEKRDGRRSRNARIDAIMRRAGHKVLRYTEIPKRTLLAADFKKPAVRRKQRHWEQVAAQPQRDHINYGERRRTADRRSGITYIDDNFIERRDNPDRRQHHSNVTHLGGFIERQERQRSA